MKSFANTLVSMVDRLISKINPLSTFIDRIVVVIAPQSIAVACSGTYCESHCEWHYDSACYKALGCPVTVNYYAAGFNQCESGAFNCTQYTSCCGGGYCD
jgi:hypothetical protein